MSPSPPEGSHSSHAASPPLAADASLQRRSEYLTGILLLLVVVFLWTASNFLTNTVLTSGYDKPFFVTYANTSSFALYLVPFLLSKRLRNKVVRGAQRRGESSAHPDALEDGHNGEGWLKKLGFDLPSTTAVVPPHGVVEESEAERGAYRPVARSNSPLLSSTAAAHYSNADGSLGAPRPYRRELSTHSVLLNLDRPRSLRASNASLVSYTARPSSIDGRRPRTEIALLTEVGDDSRAPPTTLPPLTLRQTAVLACQFTLVWFGANWSINAGLGLTSVASGTTIGSASGFFTLGLGALLGVDRFTVGRIAAVSMSFAGVLLVTAADAGTAASGDSAGTGAGALVARAAVEAGGTGPTSMAASPINAPLGDMLALLSAFLYSIYVMLLKVKIGSEDRISMPLMFGLVGAFNIVALWPIGLALHVTGIETFELPSDPTTWLGVLINMSITLVSDLVYLMAMLKSSPLASTLGLSLTIPLAVAGDVYRGSHSGGTQAALGSVLVLASFVAIGVADNLALREGGGAPYRPLPQGPQRDEQDAGQEEAAGDGWWEEESEVGAEGEVAGAGMGREQSGAEGEQRGRTRAYGPTAPGSGWGR